jgi:hypothetical protein
MIHEEGVTQPQMQQGEAKEASTAPGSTPASPESIEADAHLLYVALAPFPGGDHGKLGFKLGDVFVFLKKANDDWYHVKTADGIVGLAPANYLRKMPQKSLERRKQFSDRPLGSTDSLGPAPAPATVDAMVSAGGADILAPVLPPHDVDEKEVWYRAIHEFSSPTTGKLSFVSGDQFRLIEEKNADWLVVENSEGRRGLVPRSFVEVCTVSRGD